MSPWDLLAVLLVVGLQRLMWPFLHQKKWHQLTGDIRSPSDLTEISGVMTLVTIGIMI